MADREARRAWNVLAIAAIFVGVVARFSFLGWSDRWGPHHPDEHILPLEALALWEGVQPREVGWPASTTRLALSATLAAEWVLDEGAHAVAIRRSPGQALENVAVWIGNRLVEPAVLYRTGRVLSALTGVLHLLVALWALRQWTGPTGMTAGGLALAISPVAVVYSQYVLADITGALFATAAVGLAANPTRRRILFAAAFSGLAAMSKLHFGIWILMPFLSIWLSAEHVHSRWRLTAICLLVFTATTLVLMPWFWLNPLLTAKEVATIVGSKLGDESSRGLVSSLAGVVGPLGAMTWLGALLSLPALRGSLLRRLLPLLAPVVLGAVALANSAVVFDRYGLVLMPGLLVLAGVGCEHVSRTSPTRARPILAGVLVVVFLTNSLALAHTLRAASEKDVDALTRDWVLTHVPRGRRVAIHDEMNAFLPRTSEQLRKCAERSGTRDEFVEKWRLLGLGSASTDIEPFHSALLNDEMFRAYICRRELAATRDPGYTVIRYHQDPRFQAILERDAIHRFTEASSTATDGIDVLILNREMPWNVKPAAVIQTGRGTRVVYMH